jgi:hypothetical protein
VFVLFSFSSFACCAVKGIYKKKEVVSERHYFYYIEKSEEAKKERVFIDEACPLGDEVVAFFALFPSLCAFVALASVPDETDLN